MAKEKDDVFETIGTVESASNGIYLVKVKEGSVVKCKISGKMRTHNINVLVGDSVKVHVSAYDTSMGRIIFRSKI